MRHVIITFLSSSIPEESFPSIISNNELLIDKFVFYDCYIPAKGFSASTHRSYLQIGHEKSEKLMNAFLKAFLKNYNSVVYFDANSDHITEDLIKKAIAILEGSSSEVVVSGEKNGVLNLLGMKSLKPQIFEKDLLFEGVVSLLEDSQISFCQISQLESSFKSN